MTKQKKRETGKRKRANTPKRGRHSAGTEGTPATKTRACLDLLSRPTGATIEEMQKVTGWQPHSVRGLLAGKIGKMPGMKLTSEKPEDGPRRYHARLA